jgi:hypothetical protein
MSHYAPLIRGTLAVSLAGLLALSGCANGNPGDNDNANTNINTNTNITPGTLPLGNNCSQSRECQSELCLGVGQELLCSESCDSGPCPSEFYCAYVDVQIAPAGEDVPSAGFYCLPDRGGLCKPCGSDINCTFAGDRCLDLGDGAKVCGRDCQKDGTCPVGYECRQGQCWPTLNTCDCVPERVGATRACQEMNEFGVCLGVQTCNAEGWDDCSAGIPSFEVCNGLDDDCDGSLPSDELDSDSNGTIDCMENCTPSAEVCDSEDNDCNGVVDDGDVEAMCGTATNGDVICLHGECIIGTCEEGYVDLDGELTTGCECMLTTTGGENCTLAEVVSPLTDVIGGQTEVRSGILQENEERWYYIQAIDELDTGPNACDNFHFRVQLTVNPGDAYQLDVLAEHCAGTDECASENEVVDFQRYRNYRDESNPADPMGECPCADEIIPGQPDTGEGKNKCTDNSMVYLIRIYRKPASALTCDPYELEFTNGVYPAPI